MTGQRAERRPGKSWLRERVILGLESHSRGQIAIMVALVAVIMFAFLGIALDVGRLYVTKAQLSRSVDAAALAGVLDLPDTGAACTTAENYFDENVQDADAIAICTSPGENQLRVTGSKPVDMTFLKIIGISEQTVSAKATAGFGVAALDAAMVIDATGSMDDGCNSSQNNSGCPIYEAKEAAKDFKDLLLGSVPDGSTSVGATALRGCYRAGTQTAWAPMSLTGKPLCVRDDSTSSSWVTPLTNSLTTLDSKIDNINSEGGSGTNPCGGLAKGWEILEGPGNHLDVENNLRFLVLLSDGDSNYYGHYTYQSSPFASPHTYQFNPCQPPSSCSDVGGETSTSGHHCHNGVHVPATTLASDNFDGPSSSCPAAWNSGSGWAGDWTRSPTTGNDAPTFLTSSSPNDTSCHVRIRGTGVLTRPLNLASAITPSLTYYAKYNSWESGDDVLVRVGTTSSGPWTTLRTHTTVNTGTSYSSNTVDLTAYVGSTIYLRFEGSMTAASTGDDFFLDTIVVTTGMPGSSNGYQNGQDGSPTGCSTARPRERQVDKLTWEMAKDIQADGVEIFVVGLGTCDPSPATLYTDAQCDTQIGNDDHDNIADERLIKCIASSTTGSNDHYFYAATAAELPTIFTQIARQISHRLIE